MKYISRTLVAAFAFLCCALSAQAATKFTAPPAAPQATQPLAPAATVGQVLISEFRFRGSGGGTDEFTELYNNTDGPLDISGHTLQSVTAGLVHTVPGALGSNTTVIPARGHYLITGAGYSLTAVATSNGTQNGIGDSSSIGFFAGTTATAANRIDSVGFNTTNAIYFEGTALTPSTGITTSGEHSFVRRLNSGTPQDTDNNNNDFVFVSTTGGTFSTRVSILGAPGPENLASPVQRNAQFKSSYIDPLCPGTRLNPAATSACGRERNTTAVTNGAQGTLAIRRRFTNSTGADVTRLRFRVIDITTLNSPVVTAPPQADLRVLTSPTQTATCTDEAGNAHNCQNGTPTTSIQGLTLEPPTQAAGGGLNSSLLAGTITLETPLAAGGSIDVQFLLGVQTAGSFRFFVNVEALTAVPAPPTAIRAAASGKGIGREGVDRK
ncbi:MAG: lamin tail domain-containing protein [Acidobacteria bacterium]|nr:lamin tail domain-containing protein [Acidobacteriota bacterium]